MAAVDRLVDSARSGFLATSRFSPKETNFILFYVKQITDLAPSTQHGDSSSEYVPARASVVRKGFFHDLRLGKKAA
jgi:hypothetical protein